MKLLDLTEVFRFLTQSDEELARYLPNYEESLLDRRVDPDGFFEDVFSKGNKRAPATD
jgi:hypothetical protein